MEKEIKHKLMWIFGAIFSLCMLWSEFYIGHLLGFGIDLPWFTVPYIITCMLVDVGLICFTVFNLEKYNKLRMEEL